MRAFYFALGLCLCLQWLAGCAHLQRPGIINKRLEAEAEEVRQQAEALKAWYICFTRYRDSWDPQYITGCEETPTPPSFALATLGMMHVCGPYPGHGYTGNANPDEKGFNLLNVNPGNLPLAGAVLGETQ